MSWFRKLLHKVLLDPLRDVFSFVGFGPDRHGASHVPATDGNAALTDAQIQALGSQDIAALSTHALNALSAAQFGLFSSAQATAFSSAQLGALETSDLHGFNTAATGALSTAALAGLTSAQMLAFSPAQITALGSAQVRALSTEQIAAFSSAQIAALEPRDLEALRSEQITALTPQALHAMSPAQLDALFLATPMVLDLDGNGIQTSPAAQGVHFDMAATGTAAASQALWGWVAGGDGLLVRDRNHDGVINDGSELFGLGTRLADGTRAANGFAAMAAEDSNHDGKLNALDAHWKELQLWVDANHNGKTEPGELHSLAEFHITEIKLQAQTGVEVNHGNLLGWLSTYRTDDDKLHDMADVWFAKQSDAAPAFNEVLIPAQRPLLDAAFAGPPSVPSVPISTALVIEKRLLVDDEPRALPLI